LSVSVKSLAVKTTSEMTYVVSGGALNSTHSPLSFICCAIFLFVAVQSVEDAD